MPWQMDIDTNRLPCSEYAFLEGSYILVLNFLTANCICQCHCCCLSVLMGSAEAARQ